VAPRARLRAYGSAAAVVVAGVVCALVVHGLTGELVGLTLLTLGLGAVVLLVFYEIGLSEDRDRAREEENRRRASDDLSAPPRRSSSFRRRP
jgi:hypothetical protein